MHANLFSKERRGFSTYHCHSRHLAFTTRLNLPWSGLFESWTGPSHSRTLQSEEKRGKAQSIQESSPGLAQMGLPGSVAAGLHHILPRQACSDAEKVD